MTNEAHEKIAGIVADRFRDDAARLGATPADRALIESAAYLAALSALEHDELGAPGHQTLQDGKPAALFRAGRVYRTGLERYPERTDLAAHERAAFRAGAAWQADQIAQDADDD